MNISKVLINYLYQFIIDISEMSILS